MALLEVYSVYLLFVSSLCPDVASVLFHLSVYGRGRPHTTTYTPTPIHIKENPNWYCSIVDIAWITHPQHMPRGWPSHCLVEAWPYNRDDACTRWMLPLQSLYCFVILTPLSVDHFWPYEGHQAPSRSVSVKDQELGRGVSRRVTKSKQQSTHWDKLTVP